MSIMIGNVDLVWCALELEMQMRAKLFSRWDSIARHLYLCSMDDLRCHDR